MNVVELARALIRAESVTPAGAPVFDIVDEALTAAGFSVTRLTFGEDGTSVDNLFATKGEGGRHIALAGHVDVVPPGNPADWRHPPFAAAVDGDTLYGRGAQDMKGAVAAMIVAGTEWAGGEMGGQISFLITGDEEGPAIHGTKPLVAWAAERVEVDACIVGEPTSREVLGDTIKIGRRGSTSGEIVVTGKQGHVAYQALAHNPIPTLLAIGEALNAPLDEGSDTFDPSNLEIVSVDVSNPAFNVIPAEARLRFNVRANDLWTTDTLKEALSARVRHAAPKADITITWQEGASEAFVTRDPVFIQSVSDAIERQTGVRPTPTTGGGTSDARFIKDHFPVIEFGAVGSTMHQVDERTSLSELERLKNCYLAIIDSVLIG